MPDLPRSLLIDEQPAPQRIGIDFQKPGQLGQVHGGIELEVAADRRRPHVVLHLLHEDREMVLNGIDVEMRVVEVRRRGRDELRARGAEELLEDG